MNLMQNGPDENTQLPGTYDPQERFAEPRRDEATEGKYTQPYLAGTDEPDLDADPVATMLYGGDAHRELATTAIRREAPGNADQRDRPHFLRNVDGEERCGQDGQPWPCDAWRSMTEKDRAIALPAEAMVDREQVAAALGMPLAELDAALAAAQGRGYDAPPMPPEAQHG